MPFNHAFEVAFEVTSNTADGSDVTPAMFREAILRRIETIEREGSWNEAIGVPFDSYRVPSTHKEA